MFAEFLRKLDRRAKFSVNLLKRNKVRLGNEASEVASLDIGPEVPNLSKGLCVPSGV